MRRTLIDAGPGTPDGLRVDTDGNLWIGHGARTAPSDRSTESGSDQLAAPACRRGSHERAEGPGP